MFCTPKNPAIRRYTYRLLVAMSFYIAFIVVAVYAFREHITGPLAYLLAALPALPIVAMLAIIGLYLAEEKDEFQRNVLVQSILWAVGATLSFTTIWGFLELFVAVPHFDLYLVFPLFWGLVGVASPLLKRRYR